MHTFLVHDMFFFAVVHPEHPNCYCCINPMHSSKFKLACVESRATWRNVIYFVTLLLFIIIIIIVFRPLDEDNAALI